MDVFAAHDSIVCWVWEGENEKRPPVERGHAALFKSRRVELVTVQVEDYAAVFAVEWVNDEHACLHRAIFCFQRKV